MHLERVYNYFLLPIAFFILFYLASLNIELVDQVKLGLFLTVFLIFLIYLPISKILEIRLIIFLLGAFLALRYLFWRTTNTIIFTNFLDFIPMLLLYLAEFYSIVIFLTGLVINVLPISRERKTSLEEDDLPFVDILIPTYNEPLDVLKITAIGCKLIDYPKDRYKIHILDDGATEEKINSNIRTVRNRARVRKEVFKRFCEEYGFEYRTRKDNSHAKAGNLNAALPHCTGELILVLDCDHVPTRDILKSTVGFFQKDPKLFLVQTPHFIINENPVEKNLGLFADAPAENEMFYGVIQKGLDFWNSSFFCGSAALLRRKYLVQSGGIAGETITEDAETSIELHAKGLRSLYFEYPVTSGLAPETFKDFIVQRVRWAQGMIQILLLKNPLFYKGLKIYQKLCYTNCSLFWLFGIARSIFIIAPLLYLFFGLRVYMASVSQVIAYALPFLLASFYISNYLFGQVRWPLFSELYETALSIFLLPATLKVFFKPKHPRFLVTPKGQSLVKDYFSPLGWFYACLCVACFFSLPFAYYKWNLYPLDRDVVIICTCWVSFHIIILLMCLGSVYERHQWRKHPRTWASGKVEILLKDKPITLSGKILDLSLGGIGIRLKGYEDIEQGEKTVIFVQDSYGNKYSFNSKIVRAIKKKDEYILGLQFIVKDSKEFEELVSYVYGDSYRWESYQRRKRKKVPIVKGVIYLINKGIEASYISFKEIIKLFTLFSKKAYRQRLT